MRRRDGRRIFHSRRGAPCRAEVATLSFRASQTASPKLRMPRGGGALIFVSACLCLDVPSYRSKHGIIKQNTCIGAIKVASRDICRCDWPMEILLRDFITSLAVQTIQSQIERILHNLHGLDTHFFPSRKKISRQFLKLKLFSLEKETPPRVCLRLWVAYRRLEKQATKSVVISICSELSSSDIDSCFQPIITLSLRNFEQIAESKWWDSAKREQFIIPSKFETPLVRTN